MALSGATPRYAEHLKLQLSDLTSLIRAMEDCQKFERRLSLSLSLSLSLFRFFVVPHLFSLFRRVIQVASVVLSVPSLRLVRMRRIGDSLVDTTTV